MSDLQTLTITPENEEEVRLAAQSATDAADGITRDAEGKVIDPTNPVEIDTKPVEGEPKVENKVEDKTVDDLGIKPKADDENKVDLGDGNVIDMEDYFEEFAKDGKLGDESTSKIVKALEGAGFKDAEGLLDGFIDARVNLREVTRQAVFTIAGGENAYAELATWAGENLPADDVAAFNEMVDTKGMANIAVRGLMAQRAEMTGVAAPTPSITPQTPAPNTGRVQAGAPANTGGGTPLRTLQEISVFTADPRYDSDPGFRASIDARIQAGL